MSWIILTPTEPIEARRWTVVFHRKAENRFFSLIALGHFKHVSAFAWLPDLGIWTYYDVGFRRTRIVHLADGVAAHAYIAAVVKGNCVVTIDVRTDALPLIRWGMFCTSGVAHLIGMQSGTLRPDNFFRQCLRSGGVLNPGDDQWQPHQTFFRRTFSRCCSIMTQALGTSFGKFRTADQSVAIRPDST